MLTLRLARAGTKKRPVYHLVATDSRSRRDGRFVENLGYYIPARKVLVVKQDRIDYWMSVGAQSTETAKQLIKQARKHGNVEPQAKPTFEAPAPKAEAKKETPKAEKAEKAEKPEAKAKPEEGEKKEELKAEAEGGEPASAPTESE